MNCQVCGCLEGEGPCGECRALALEMSANAEALAELRFDEIQPAVKRPVYRWLAAAAVVILTIFMHSRVGPPAEAPTEALTIKMLTPDPTVVIYWLADAKEEKR